MLIQNVKMLIVKLPKGELFMKIRLFALLMVSFFISSCANDQYIGSDSLLVDDSFRDIPTHDSVDCFGSCTVKIYNRN